MHMDSHARSSLSLLVETHPNAITRGGFFIIKN